MAVRHLLQQRESKVLSYPRDLAHANVLAVHENLLGHRVRQSQCGKIDRANVGSINADAQHRSSRSTSAIPNVGSRDAAVCRCAMCGWCRTAPHLLCMGSINGIWNLHPEIVA